MSISILRGVYRRLCRQSYIWSTASRRPHPAHCFTVLVRAAHNNLYQMVKKRTLEARTKMQANRFPNNQACLPEMPLDKDHGHTAPSSTKPFHRSGVIQKSSDSIPIPKANKSTAPNALNFSSKLRVQTNDNEKPKPICQNTEILRARDCHNTPVEKRVEEPKKTAPVPCPPTFLGSSYSSSTTSTSAANFSSDRRSSSRNECEEPKDPCVGKGGGTSSGGSGSGDGKPSGEEDCDEEARRKRMMLYALLAALGAGGLLWWFLSRRKSDDDDDYDDTDGCVGGRKTIPSSSDELPEHVPYVLVGGGAAAFSAFRAIKANDPRAKVLMINEELRKPYMRPPLSKELWYSAEKGAVSKDLRFKQWTGAERSLYFEPDEFFVDPRKLMSKTNGGIAVAQGFKVTSVNPERRIVTLSDGYEIGYDECLIATGCSSKNLPVFEFAPVSVKDKVMVYRTPEDFERLKLYADQNKIITIIGNGFTGSELACSLANYTKKRARIYQVFPEEGNMSKVLPKYLSKWTTQKVEASGVCVINNVLVKEATREDSKVKLTMNNGNTLLTDIVVVCVGCEPNTEIANASGLETSKRLGGFVVNSELEARRNLYVAGDAACFFDPLLGRRRVEHHDHSVVSGRLAGENMTGKNKSYSHQSMFWSDLGPDIGYEGIGLVDATLPTVVVFALPSKGDPRTENFSEGKGSSKSDKSAAVRNEFGEDDHYGRGVIFYIKNDKIVGILLWNLFNRIGLARTVINQNKKYEDLNEVAKLFEIHS